MTTAKVRLAAPTVGAEERAAVDRVLASGSLSQGPEVASFESEFSELVDGRRCVAVNSGTSALHLALLGLGIGPGDEVIVPSFTFAATANAVCLTGARPVFADIDPQTFCLSSASAAAVVTDRTAAIMPVHLFGHPAPIDGLRSLSSRHGLALVEDAAQAHAASIDGRPAGTLGDAAAFSFYPTKNMTSGEGGMIVFADAAAERRARLLRNQGMDLPYTNELVGFNLRMTDISAAIGRVQLRRLDGFTRLRRAHAERLTTGLARTRVTPPLVSRGVHHVFHQFTVRTTERDALMAHLDDHGIESRVFYPTPAHRLPAFDLPAELPMTEQACAEVLSLPVGPHLDNTDIDLIIEGVRSWV